MKCSTQCFIVGGAVRDLLMGRMPHEADMAFSGTAEDFVRLFPKAQQVGKSVQVWIVDGLEYMPLLNNDIYADLTQRDLTINALALDQEGVLYAHALALFDIKNSILRPASAQSFYTDPLRIYRLARFAAAYPHFILHDDALEQAQAVTAKKLHRELPAERVGRELFKALQLPCPARFFTTLEKTKALTPWFTPWTWLSQEQKDLWSHATQCAAEQSLPLQAQGYQKGLWRWMLLGALESLGTSPSLSADALTNIGQTLALPMAFTKAAQCMAKHFSKARILNTLTLKEQIILVLDVHKKGLSELFWAAIDHMDKHILGAKHLPQSTYALKILGIVLSVHLTQEWQNQGPASGEKLLELQIEKLRKEV